MAQDRSPSGPRLSVRVGLKEISYLDLLAEFYPDLFSDSPPDGLFENQLRFFLNVARLCLEHYSREKEKINVLDFADLESLCHRFLTQLYESEDTNGLRRIQRKFKYVMVDEFQDTNRVQWEIISLLCSNRDQDGKGDLFPGRLFVVGDKRQAIYKFRGGDVTVFEYGTEKIRQSNPERPVQMFWQDPILSSRVEEIKERYAGLLKRHAEIFNGLPREEREKILMGDIYLPENFRTDGRPISFLNTTFERIFSNRGAKRLQEYETAPMPIRMPDGDQRVAESAGSVTIYLAQGSVSRKDQAEREASLILDIIENLLGKNGKERFEYGCYADIREKIEKNQLAIGILLFAFTHLKTYEEVLREAGLPFKVHRGKGFYRCQEVMEMIQLLNYLSNERQRLSLLAALRSPIFALKDSEIFDLFYGQEPNLERFLLSDNRYVRSVGEQIQAWRFLSTRMTTAELIRRIIADRGLTASYTVHPNGMQRLANVEKLVGIARHFQAEGNGLHQFVEYCLEMVEEEEEEGEALIVSEGESPIWLMTIHAAKGLEFPMVIIPDLHRPPPTRTPLGRPIRLYSSGRGKPGRWNSQEGEIPIWPIEIPQLDYKKVYGPLGHLLMRRNKLEEMAENRRVFYVGCTRTRNHLILMGHTQKRMMEKDKTPLSTEDYRGKATILDLLDDIYQFNLNFPATRSPIFEGKGGHPVVIWKEPRPRKFRGITYGGEKVKGEDFGSHDDEIEKLDLTEPVRSSPYYQFSFKSMRIFKKCPMLFYYSVILGLEWNELRVNTPKGDGPHSPGGGLNEIDDHDYVSKEALFVGNAIHGYLEGHRFGNPLDRNLFNAVWGRLNRPDLFADGLEWEVMRSLRGKVLKHLETTVHDRRLLKMLGGKVQHAEVPFFFSINPGCEFRGTIDRLFKEEEQGPWIIIDWKSNDLSDRDPRLVVEENYYHLQLACYKWAVEHILREKVGDLYIYFTDGGTFIKSHWEGHPEEVIEEMLQKVKDYEADRSRWVQDLRKLKMSREDCLYCQFQANLCRQEGP
jgi:ATP-dependent exoDNAse (exonuclease V) beta subunit